LSVFFHLILHFDFQFIFLPRFSFQIFLLFCPFFKNGTLTSSPKCVFRFCMSFFLNLFNWVGRPRAPARFVFFWDYPWVSSSPFNFTIGARSQMSGFFYKVSCLKGPLLLFFRPFRNFRRLRALPYDPKSCLFDSSYPAPRVLRDSTKAGFSRRDDSFPSYSILFFSFQLPSVSAVSLRDPVRNSCRVASSVV